jgi:hypothetical protein
MKRPRNHYDFLEEHLPKFFEDLNVLGGWAGSCGIISAHGDKFSQYKSMWEKEDIHFFHGCMLMMLTYVQPFSKESREVQVFNGVTGFPPPFTNGAAVVITTKWVDPYKWVIEVFNSGRFKEFLPPIEGE